MVVEDAATDALLTALTATSALQIRAYVGVPVLLGDGSLYGTLCGVDRDPRPSDPAALEALIVLARMVAFQIEIERRARLEGIVLAARTAQHEANNRLVAAVAFGTLLERDGSLPNHLKPHARRAVAAAREAADALHRLAEVTQIEEIVWGPDLVTIDLDRSR